jgi:hypothetical protein
MAVTVIRGTQVHSGTIQRVDLDTSTVGQAVVAKLIQGTNVTLSSTGGDAGTGDVTVSVPTVMFPVVYGNAAFSGTATVTVTGATTVVCNLVMSATGTIGLDRLASGVPVNIFAYNNTLGAINFGISVNDPTGAAYATVQGCRNGAIVNLTSGVSIPSVQGFNFNGIAIYSAALGYKLELTY